MTSIDETIIVCPGGPLLVRGADRVVVGDTTHEVERPVVALCRCGCSRIRPYCDSTHKVVTRRERA